MYSHKYVRHALHITVAVHPIVLQIQCTSSYHDCLKTTVLVQYVTVLVQSLLPTVLVQYVTLLVQYVKISRRQF